MQDRYVGDVGDYAKYALLEVVSDAKLRTGVVWCLFPDEGHNGDGRHISYLSKRGFRPLHPALFDRLGSLVGNDQRAIRYLADLGILSGACIGFEECICQVHALGKTARPQDRQAGREAWLNRCLGATKECDLVFFDPDNGLASPSMSRRDLKAGKYIFVDELDAFYGRGQSLLVYHHLNRRSSAEAQVRKLRADLESRFEDSTVWPLLFRRGSCRAFCFVLRKSAAGLLLPQLDAFMRRGWKAHFDPMPAP